MLRRLEDFVTYIYAVHQTFTCNYHQHLPDYRTGSLPQMQRSVAIPIPEPRLLMHDGEREVLPTSSQKSLSRVGHERPLNTNSCADQPTDMHRVHKSCIEELKRRWGVKTTKAACPHTAKVKHAKPKAHNGLLKAHWIAIEC